MKKLALVVGFLMLGSTPAWALSKACSNPNYSLKPIGSAQTGTAVITTAGASVDALSVVCTSTACALTLYDSDGDPDGATNALVRFEAGAAASTAYFEIFDKEIQFSDGIYAADDGNVQGYVLLGCQP